ncbi:MAG: VOC family protein, partial [Anaerolineae bacterium]
GYTVFVQNGRSHAGMMQIDENWGDVPPNWAIYFMVTDLDAITATAQALGGRVLVPSTSAGDMGHFAVLQDPQGAVFTAMQIDPAFVDPPPGA